MDKEIKGQMKAQMQKQADKQKKMNEPFICRKRSATANTKLIQQQQN